MKLSQNRPLQYVLVATVLAIWGTVVWQVLHLRSANPSTEESFPSKDESVIPPIATGTFQYTLLLDYSDPFQGKRKVAPSSSPRPQSALPGKPAPPTQRRGPGNRQVLKYLAYAENADGRRVLIQIGQRDHYLQAGDRREGLVLSQISRDSITVRWEGQTKTIYREGAFTFKASSKAPIPPIASE